MTDKYIWKYMRYGTYGLVAPDGEVVATVYEGASTWLYKAKEYIDKQSAMSAAEKDIGAADRAAIDRNALANELTDAFIQYQHRLDNPMSTFDETLYMLRLKYNTDDLFRRKVDSLVSGVMRIISKHIKD